MRECLIFLYYNGKIVESAEGVTFRSKNCLSFYIDQYVNFESFRGEIISRLSAETERSICNITYRFPISVINQKPEYRPYLLRNDNDLQLLFDSYRRYYPEISAAEIIVDFEDGDVDDAAETSRCGGDETEHALGEYGDSSGEDDPDFCCSEEEEEEEEDDELGSLEEISLPIEDLPADMFYLNIEAMNAPEFPEMANRTFIPSSMEEELRVGMQFQNKDDVQDMIKHYSVRKFVDYKVVKSNPTRYLVQCKMYGEGCDWRLLASFLQRSRMWEITRYNGPHTCAAREFTLDHRKLDSNMICRCILPLVQKNSSLAVAVLQAEIKSRYNHEPSYRKTWIAKQKAVERLFGNWEESFAELPIWLNAMQQFIPGSVYFLQTGPAHDKDGNVEAGKKEFRRVFWAYGPCIEAARYCKPVVQIDGTHLYGKYRGTLLVAVSQDGNRNIVPLAFAIVEGETFEAWDFFLQNLRQFVIPQDGMCYISDRHNSIKAVMKRGGDPWHPPRAYHVYCIRHIGANVLQQFGSQQLKHLVVNAGMSYK